MIQDIKRCSKGQLKKDNSNLLYKSEKWNFINYKKNIKISKDNYKL